MDPAASSRCIRSTSNATAPRAPRTPIEPTMHELPLTLSDKEGETFTVRAYDAADRKPLAAMYDDFLPKRAAQGLPPAAPEGVARWLDRVLAGGRHFVVEIGGRLCGHAMLMPLADETVELATFLHQRIRDRGIGTALNRLALDIARRDGARRVWLSVEPSNRLAIRSYEKVGFRRLPGSLWAPELEMAADLAVPCAAES
jgi:RimJ/RimL family protein N-acetyltransferase